jgi:hypothetical protein
VPLQRIGIDFGENQTLPERQTESTDLEKKQLIALKTLTDKST